MVQTIRRPLESILSWTAPLRRSPAAPGLLLLFVTLLTLAWANSPAAGAHAAMVQWPLRLGIGDVALQKPLLLWVNDGLMAVFFLLVGLEVKREIVDGALSSFRAAALPLAAALGGMVVPAAIYLALNPSGPGAAGWGVPIATDIAFALGILALIRKHVPAALVIFLTAFAVADDLGAVAVIAIFYTDAIALPALGAAALLAALLFGMNRAGVRALSPYLLLGLVLWVAVLKSGVHATVAGVVLAAAIPFGSPGQTPLLRLEHALAPWVAWAIVPVFALFNAGVVVEGLAGLTQPVTAGVAGGLVFGKLIGITGASWLAVRVGLARLPAGVNWLQIVGLGLLGGVGFTMSIFVAGLAFPDAEIAAAARLGILAGSGVSALAGVAVLRLAAFRPEGAADVVL